MNMNPKIPHSPAGAIAGPTKRQPSLGELVKSAQAWQRRTFTSATAASAVEHMRREVLELHAHYWEQVGVDDDGEPIFKLREEPTGTPAERAEENTDVFFMSVQHAQCEGYDLRDPFAKKLAKNIGRQWGEPDEHGVVEHVREA